MSATDARVVLITAPHREAADRLARDLVEMRLCACVNLIENVTSVYRWEGKVNEDREVLCVVKTTADALDALTARVEKIHPYDVPEVIALPVVAGSAAYLDWVRGQVHLG